MIDELCSDIFLIASVMRERYALIIFVDAL